MGLHGPDALVNAPAYGNTRGFAWRDNFELVGVKRKPELPLCDVAPSFARGVRDVGQVTTWPHDIDHVVDEIICDAALRFVLRLWHGGLSNIQQGRGMSFLDREKVKIERNILNLGHSPCHLDALPREERSGIPCHPTEVTSVWPFCWLALMAGLLDHAGAASKVASAEAFVMKDSIECGINTVHRIHMLTTSILIGNRRCSVCIKS